MNRKYLIVIALSVGVHALRYTVATVVSHTHAKLVRSQYFHSFPVG